MKEFFCFCDYCSCLRILSDWLWGCFRQHLFCGAGCASHREHGSTDGHANHHPAPDAESSEAVEKSLFDPASADYTGSVVEMTDTGFTLSPTVVQRQGADASAAVMAEAGTASSVFSVTCTDDTRYIAIYADGNGSSRQAEGSADMVAGKGLCVYHRHQYGQRFHGGYRCHSEPVKPAVTRALLTVSLGWMALSVWWPLWFLFFGGADPGG